ncbi:PRC and DUF2382 domain-containing protein [Streptomyces catenulae]|uniref:PRC and DUF2382 domain-containing protein n=1 Tax=Streptomyces catenulae TaxID=66875 RepID=A0ABV2YUW1_9ACTN|nr:PRC and DUF2382 domain-containing protein [Streptomyces catenulae]
MNAPLGDTPQDLTGLNVVDAEGAKVGSVQQVYRDDATNVPEWITVRTGLFGMKETFIPLAGARRVDDELHVPHTKETIKEAPRIDADGHLDPSEEDELYRHYGLTRPGTTGGPKGADTGSPAGTTTGTPGTAKGTTGMAAGTAAGGAAGMAAAGHRTRAGERDRTMAEGEHAARTEHTGRPMAGAGMSRGRAEGEAPETGKTREQVPEIVLSEERIQIGTEEREAGRAHLRKHVVTEDVHRTVPLSHEEVRLVREKISDEERMRGRTAPRLGDGEVEVVLHEEEAVVTKRTVPVERVRLETERVTVQQEINTELRKEEVEFDDGTSLHKEGRKGPGPERRR